MENTSSQEIASNPKRLKLSSDCAVQECDYSCSYSHCKTDIKCHRFPRNDSTRLAKWIEFCQNPFLSMKLKQKGVYVSSYFICSQHFSDSDYIVGEKKPICPTLRPIQDNFDSKKVIKKTFKCSVLECDFYRSRPYYKADVKWHYFPKNDLLMYAEWVKFCRNPYLNNITMEGPIFDTIFICSQHFSDSDYAEGEKKVFIPSLRSAPAAQGSYLPDPNGNKISRIQPPTSAEDITAQDSTNKSKSERVKTNNDCAVMECDYNRLRPHYKTGTKNYCFPRNLLVCAEWIKFCQNPALSKKIPGKTYKTKNAFICGQHFSIDESGNRALVPTIRPIPAAFLGPNGGKTSPIQTSPSAGDIPSQDIASDSESQYSDNDYAMDDKSSLLFTAQPIIMSCLNRPEDTPSQDTDFYRSRFLCTKGKKSSSIKPTTSAASKPNLWSTSDDFLVTDRHQPMKTMDPQELINSSAIVLSKIYANPELDRKYANETIQMMATISSSEGQNNVVEVISQIVDRYCPTDDAFNKQKVLEMLAGPLKNSLSTEEKRMDFYKQMGTLPEIRRLKPDFATLNIECIAKNFLHVPGVLDSIVKEHSSKKKRSDAVLDSFMKGAIWQENKSQFNGDFLTIPLALYFVTIGSASCMDSSNLAVFLTFPSLPHRLLLSEESHFLVGTIGKNCATMKTFLQIIETELRSLLSGLISMDEINGQICRMKFCLAFAYGTKDGLQQFLGLERDCIFCSERFEESIETKTLIHSEEDIVRGFKCENFVLHRDVVPDFAEDWLLKICIWNLNLVFVGVIPEKIGLNVANQRLQLFKIHSPDKKDLVAHGIESVAVWLESLTAEEVLRLVCYLPFVFGDYIPLKSDSGWRLFMELREIVYALLGFIGKKGIPKLGNKIAAYLTQCKGYFLDDKLPNYFHVASHYPNAYEKFGPFEQFLTMRSGVNKICQRLQNLYVDFDEENLVDAFSWKEQMVMNERFLSKRGPSNDCENKLLVKYPLSPALIKQFDLASKYPIEGLKRVEFFCLQEEEFLPNSIVISGHSGEHLQFSKIQHILLSDAGDLCWCLCYRFKTACFDKHYGSYRVVATEEPEIVDLLQLEWKYPVRQIFSQDGSNFIVLDKAYQWID